MRSASLRVRLIGCIAIGLVISLVLGTAIAAISASRSVQIEMRSALAVARSAIENTAAVARDSAAPHQLLSGTIAAFDGNRHVRLRFAGDGHAVAASRREHATFGSVPGWFQRMSHVEPGILLVPLHLGDTSTAIVIETDPHNETIERWNAFCDTLTILTFFCALTFAVIYVGVGRALRPLAHLGEAFKAIARGDYTTRLTGTVVPEFTRLAGTFNHMARRLDEADLRNRRLTEQLLTVQEDERREIARDLHDEIGPFLFAVNVDAESIVRLAESGSVGEIPAAVRRITEAVGHMQGEVRSMLHRLRPIGLGAFGLPDTLHRLIEFWRERHPEIDFHLEIAECDDLGEALETAIYRIVQESLSNAVRHGHPASVRIRVGASTSQDALAVEVTDDGRGAAEESRTGFGLVGMAERVRALGGAFTTSGIVGGGFVVRALLPRTPPTEEHVATQLAPDGALAA